MNEFLKQMSEFSQDIERAQKDYEKKNDEWWNSLPYETRCDAFYAIVKRIYEGEIVNKGSYRYVLYNTFGFGPDMYARGMDCGFMALHNAIDTEDL
jgi:hypothetical protein